MAQQEKQLDRETLCCPICLDLLKDPVTTVCGHSYCKSCINTHWDIGDERGSYSCPRCRQTFTPRPVLGKSTMLADIVEELQKTGLQAAPADHCYAGPEDVACDVCTGRKLKALKTCLVCLASYCEKHLQPHFESAAFKKHNMVEPSKKLQENICSRHNEVLKMFCRTDQQCICYLCSVDEHKDHDTVSAAAERTERQRELGLRRQTIQQGVQDREKDVKLLQQEEEAVNGSADKAVEDSEKILAELIRLLKKRRSDVLSRESLTGRCYWEVEMEVEMEVRGRVGVAVTYKNISPLSSRVGVYLDHSAGVLSFYSVSDTMTLLHRVQTTFTQPLYAGVGAYRVKGGVEVRGLGENPHLHHRGSISAAYHIGPAAPVPCTGLGPVARSAGQCRPPSNGVSKVGK
ncbi:unnamed protein product [Pleuronectes platessa]|uniref:E3 ubiquitin/ISG15 ligase TRIM25-like n=1 Tax=Pleuronectes platessa TaxID=8262 RepID=A0A9N7W5I4_PLEPL|nr:unnamed protein product [Pleuronectes platessa]